MTAAVPDPRFRDQLVRAVEAELDVPGVTAPDIADAVLLLVEARVQAAAKQRGASVLAAAADAWQRGAWGGTPRSADRIADRIGAAQYVTDWLRARAAALVPAMSEEGA